MYDGIIFDKDGVLLDSGINNFTWMDKVKSETAERLGHELTVEDSYKLVHAETVGEVDELLQEKGMSWDDLREIEDNVQDKKKELIRYGIIQLFPQVKKILNSIEQEKALVSNAPQDVTHYTLEYFEIRKHFSKVNAPSLAKPKKYIEIKKPQPTMIEDVIDNLGFENPLMIGDTSADIKAAKKAGIDSVHVNSYDTDMEVEPTYRVPRVENILEIVKK